MRTALVALVVGLTVVSSGCASIPRSQLAQYRQAFAELDAVSEEVLLDFDQTLKRNRQVVAAKRAAAPEPVPPYPIDLEAFEASVAQRLDDIDVRRVALRTIGRYNDVLTALAEGKSVEEVKTASTGLVKALNRLVEVAAGSGIPALAAVTSVVSLVAEQVERARLRAEFVKAVREGKPIVFKVLDVFLADRKDHFTNRAGLAQEARLLILSDMTNEVGVIRERVRGHQAPAAASPGLDAKSVADAMNAALKPAQVELRGYPFTVAFGGAGPQYDETARERIEGSITQIRELGQRYADNVAAIRAFGVASMQYRGLIVKTRTALAAVDRALDEPQDVLAIAEEMLDLAFTVKRELAASRSGRGQ